MPGPVSFGMFTTIALRSGRWAPHRSTCCSSREASGTRSPSNSVAPNTSTTCQHFDAGRAAFGTGAGSSQGERASRSAYVGGSGNRVPHRGPAAPGPGKITPFAGRITPNGDRSSLTTVENYYRTWIAAHRTLCQAVSQWKTKGEARAAIMVAQPLRSGQACPIDIAYTEGRDEPGCAFSGSS